jgi:arylsulfatase
MATNRLTQILSTSIAIGFLIGLQQSSSILVSSLHNLDYFPYLSLVAIAFIVFVSITLITSILLIFSAFISVLSRSQSFSKSIWQSILVGLGFSIWCYLLISSKIGTPSQANALLTVIVVLSSLTIGSTVAFLSYSSLNLLFNHRTLKIPLHIAAHLAPKLSFLAFLLLTTFLAVNYYTRYIAGPPGFSLSTKKSVDQDYPNIVLITIDALRYDSLTSQLMPHLYSFSEQNINFPHAYSPSPWTPPSFSSMLTGNYPGELGSSVYNYSTDEVINHHRLPLPATSLAESLTPLGYLNQAIISNIYLSPRRDFHQGFQGYIHFDDIMPYHWHFHTRDTKIIRDIRSLPFVGNQLKTWQEHLVGKSTESVFHTRANMVSDTAIYWLEKQNSKSFFLWLHYIEPHSPHDPIKDYSPSLPSDLSNEQQAILRDFEISIDKVRWRDVDEQHLKALYDGENRYADFQINRVLEFLKIQPYYDDTIVIITSDHGEEFFEHDNIGHGRSLYEELIHVPLIVKLPQHQPILDFDPNKPASLTDLTPTLLDTLDISPNPERNWFSSQYSDTIFIEGTASGPQLKSAIQWPWKLIWNPDDDSHQLYNLQLDPQESNNVSSFNPRVVIQLQTFLQDRVDNNQKTYQQLIQQSDFQPAQDFGEVVGY